jgi:uncharacterized protein with von Willebrand factor type A (vWA) domain
MFVDFFFQLRGAKIPVTIREYLVLVEAMHKGAAEHSVDTFYWLARSALVKDEKYFDAYDRVFGNFFKGATNLTDRLLGAEIPDEWLKAMARRLFSDEELAKLQKLSLEELMAELAKRLQEQRGRHQGGSKWIGAGGTSPFGNSGANPAGVRIGGEGGGGMATKVWEKREFRGLAGNIELGTRNFKIALRKLRKFVREGAEDEFDLDGTIRATADNAGMLDIRMRPERKNRIKVLLMIDIGGSMDSHVRVCEELFSAARTELKHLEQYYFHNFIYERVWRENSRGYNEWFSTFELLRTYGPDFKVIWVGDATMSPYEITEVGGSIEHWNDEPGEVWLRRVLDFYPDSIWLNPVPVERWMSTPSLRITHQLMAGRMFPLTPDGLDAGMKVLRKGTPALSRH